MIDASQLRLRDSRDPAAGEFGTLPEWDLTDLYAAHLAQYQRLYHALHDEFPRFSALPTS